LEAYHLASYGIWAHVLGRLAWQLSYALAAQSLVVGVIASTVGIDIAQDANPLLAAGIFLLFVLACFGLGLAGAAMFFLLEIKEGAELITWSTTVVARVASGVYYPLAIIPFWLRPLGYLVPRTYALRAIRLILLDGRGLSDDRVARDIIILALYALGAMIIGVWLLSRGIRRGGRLGGLSVVG